MSTLVYQKMSNEEPIEQTIRILRPTSIKHIRAWLYIQGTPDGDITLSIYSGATLLASSTIDTATLLTPISEQYAHGMFRFDFDQLKLHINEGSVNEEYKIVLELTDHTDDEDNHIGWVRNWENNVYTVYGDGVVNGISPNDMIEPFGLEIYDLRR